MFYKDYLPVVRRDNLCALSECIVTEIKLGKNSMFSASNYRSPSKTTDEFENYCQNFHLTLSNIDDKSPFCSIVVGDFNARYINCWAGDLNSSAGKELDPLTSMAGYTQLTDKPTHFFNGGSSCIDLIFCNKPKTVSECGIDHSVFQTCHHSLIFAKIRANMSHPPNYSGKVWDYKSANVEGIQKSISLFEKLLEIYQLMRKLVFLTTLYLIYFAIKSKLKNRSKLTKEYYRKGQDPTIFAELSRISRVYTDLKRNAKMSYIRKK